MSSDQLVVESLAEEIAAYLEQNPQAADGVEGIMRWWLPQERRGTTFEGVQAALDSLEKRGIVRRSVLQDGHVIYGRMPTGRQGD